MAGQNIPKKRAVISYENMSEALMDAFKEKYPHGYADYMGDIFKVDKPDGTSFYAVTLEIPDALYLVKIKVKVDDYEDAEEVFKNDRKVFYDPKTPCTREAVTCIGQYSKGTLGILKKKKSK